MVKPASECTAMDRQTAWNLVTQFVQDAGLRRHMLAVEAAMRWYAQKLGEDADRWGVVGLIHDFDWEVHPTLPEHPLKGANILRERGVDENIVRTILSHYEQGTGVMRETAIDFALLACDEITGLIIAVALVRPSRNIADVKVKSIRKKWKDKSFAAGVDREHVQQAAADFSGKCFNGELDVWTHAGNVLEAMQRCAKSLELDGALAVAQ